MQKYIDVTSGTPREHDACTDGTCTSVVLRIAESKTNLHQLPVSIMNFRSLLKLGILLTALALCENV